MSTIRNIFAERGMKDSHSLATYLGNNQWGLNKYKIRESMIVEHDHKLELVAKKDDIEWINDSKSTNVNSTWFALEEMIRPVVWIAGGVRAPGHNNAPLIPLIKQKVKAIVTLGMNNSHLHALGMHCACVVNTHNMNDAITAAGFFAKRGDVVLFSPACASFDLFDNYEDRGMKFREAVWRSF